MATNTLYKGNQVYEVPEGANGREIRDLLEIPKDRQVVARYPGDQKYHIVSEHKPLPKEVKEAVIVSTICSPIRTGNWMDHSTRAILITSGRFWCMATTAHQVR